ncbi:SEFIR domain protein [compost metagenome]
MQQRSKVDTPYKTCTWWDGYANTVVFISYSWDDEDHKNWVLNLTKRLFETGVKVILDRYKLKPGNNMLHFMDTAIPKDDKVLITFTPN